MTDQLPQSFIQSVLDQTNIVDVVSKSVSLERKGNEWLGLCPFHEESSPSFSVNEKKQVYFCFGCKASGNSIHYLTQNQHLTFIDAIKMLAKHANIPWPNQSTQPAESRDRFFKATLALKKYYATTLEQNDPAKRYLNDRKLSSKTVEKYQLGYATEIPKLIAKKYHATLRQLHLKLPSQYGDDFAFFRKRLMFPILDGKGRTVGFGGRSLDDQKPKYLNSKESILFQKKKQVFGLYQVLSQAKKCKHIMIVEGYMDVLALDAHGFHNGVATLGTAFQLQQLKILEKYTDTLVFCFDGDLAGKQGAIHALKLCLSVNPDKMKYFFVMLPKKEDPDSILNQQGKSAFVKHLKLAKNITDFFMYHIQQTCPGHQMSDQVSQAKMAYTMLQSVQNSLTKQRLIKQVEALTKLSPTSWKHKADRPTKKNQQGNLPLENMLASALNLIINHPPLILGACGLTHANLYDTNLFPPIVRLMALIEAIQQNPEITSGQCLGYVDDFDLKPSMFQLTWDIDQQAQELTGYLTHINKMMMQITFAHLIKIPKTSRSDAQAAHLMKLLETKKENLG